MFFRNLTLFRFSTKVAKQLGELEESFAAAKLKPCGALEMASHGFISPFGRGEEVMVHQIGKASLFTLGREEKLLPASVVNEAVMAKVEKLQAKRDKPIGGRERKKIKEEIIHDLLPKAFSRPSRVYGYFDHQDGWLVMDTASRKVAELVSSAIREALDSFPASGAQPEETPMRVLTDWLAGGAMPEGFALGDEVELKDPADKGAVVKARRQELDSDEIREHLRAGKQVSQLAIVFQDRISFVLDEELTLRKLKFLDAAVEELENTERDSMQAELDARFALMSLSLRPLLEQIANTFAWERPQDRGKSG